MRNIDYLTPCGLPGIDRIPYGTHACHSYADHDQLVATLLAYVIAGLERNERCLWVTAPPLAAGAAIQALCEAAWPAADDAVQSGALRVLDSEHWYGTSGALRGLDVLELWLEEERRALAAGYCGLRIAGNTSFLATRDWPQFLAYERAVSEAVRGRRIVALCSYSQSRCSARQLGHAMAAHHCAFEGPDATGSMTAVSSIAGVVTRARSTKRCLGQ